MKVRIKLLYPVEYKGTSSEVIEGYLIKGIYDGSSIEVYNSISTINRCLSDTTFVLFGDDVNAISINTRMIILVLPI